jgi:hypothetical protein
MSILLAVGTMYAFSSVTEKILDGVGKVTDTVVHAYTYAQNAVSAKKTR